MSHNTDEGKAKALNTFFTSVFTDEDTSNIPSLNARLNDSYLVECATTEEEVLKKLVSLDTSKCPGADNIHPRVLFELRHEITPSLTRLFNDSLKSGILPDEWKIAKVVALHKKGEKSNPGNYRPISLTSVCCKILESILKSAISKHLVDNALICSGQHGFVEKKNCVTNLLESLNDWTKVLDSGGSVDVIRLDFAKPLTRSDTVT